MLYEVITKGKIFKMSPAPTPKHQLILGDLFVCFATFLKSKTCIPFLAPFDVRFPNHKNDINPYTVVQPDIVITSYSIHYTKLYETFSKDMRISPSV